MANLTRRHLLQALLGAPLAAAANVPTPSRSPCHHSLITSPAGPAMVTFPRGFRVKRANANAVLATDGTEELRVEFLAVRKAPKETKSHGNA